MLYRTAVELAVEHAVELAAEHAVELAACTYLLVLVSVVERPKAPSSLQPQEKTRPLEETAAQHKKECKREYTKEHKKEYKKEYKIEYKKEYKEYKEYKDKRSAKECKGVQKYSTKGVQ